MCEKVCKSILLDISWILFGSPYWLSLVMNRFQLSPCFREGTVSSTPRSPQRLFDKDSAVSETKAGETNGCQRSQFMLLSCLGDSSAVPPARRQPFSIGVVSIKTGLEASQDDWIISWIMNDCCCLWQQIHRRICFNWRSNLRRGTQALECFSCLWKWGSRIIDCDLWRGAPGVLFMEFAFYFFLNWKKQK